MAKKLFQFFFLMLICSSLVLGAEDTSQAAQQASNSAMISFIKNEELKTRSELKQFITDQTKVNQDAIQEVIDYDKKIIYADIDRKIKNAIIKLSLATFLSIVCALVTYRLIMMQIKQKFIKKELRNEYKAI